MTRIVGGSAGGRRLAVPRGGLTRPTSDRAREGLFSTLAALLPSLAGLRVLDLYAGTGAVGLEALSRGAAAALFVESDDRALQALRDNLAALRLPGGRIVRGRVATVLTGPPAGPPYDVAFLDPPYAMPDEEVHAVLRSLLRQGWLAAGAVVVLERATRAGAPPWPEGLATVRARRYGEATLWYGRATS